jgi:predicted amidohydrolase
MKFYKQPKYLFLLVLSMFVTIVMADEIPFFQPKDIADGKVSGISSMDVGDIDKDGVIDVLVVEGGKHAGGRRTFAWYKAPKDIQGQWQRFEINPKADLRSFLGSAKLADMDNDGDVDVIVSSDNHSGPKKEADVFIFENPVSEGDVSSHWNQVKVNTKTMSLHHINDMEIADMDVDGRLDVIVRSLEPNQIHIFFQNPDSTYEVKTIDTGVEQSEGLAVGRINSDKYPDITYTGFWLQAPNDPRGFSYIKKPIDPEYNKVNQNTKESIADIDRDGYLDVVIAPAEAYRNGKDHMIAWYKNPGDDYDKTWKKTIVLDQTNNHHTLKLDDMDNDGDIDIVSGVPWEEKGVFIYFNDGEGQFTNVQTVIEGKGLYSGVLDDLDGDGDIDIIAQDTYASTSKPWVYENRLNNEVNLNPRFSKDDPRVIVALLQLSSFGNDQEANLKKASRYCREAARQGADIALMGEMWNIGYTRFDASIEGEREKYWARAIAKEGPWVQHFANLAKELNMAIAVAYEQEWDPLPRNSVTIFDRFGTEIFTYAKVHTSDFKPLERNMTPGEDFYVAPLNTAKGKVMVGAMICFDREQPESARILMLKGAELVLVPNCCGLDDLRLQQFRVRACENQMGVAMTNYPKPYQNGHSTAFDPGGNCLVQAGVEEGVYYAAFDMDYIRKRRAKSIWGNAYRRPHRYSILSETNTNPVWKRIDGIGEVYDASKR